MTFWTLWNFSRKTRFWSLSINQCAWWRLPILFRSLNVIYFFLDNNICFFFYHRISKSLFTYYCFYANFFNWSVSIMLLYNIFNIESHIFNWFMSYFIYTTFSIETWRNHITVNCIHDICLIIIIRWHPCFMKLIIYQSTV